MKKYKCKVCNKFLHLNTYKARNTHINGYKHKLLKETYFMEVYEKKQVNEELEACKLHIGKNYKRFLDNTNLGFRLPPCMFSQSFVILPCPKNFKLPKFFDFTDKEMFYSSINESLQAVYKLIEKENGS